MQKELDCGSALPYLRGEAGPKENPPPDQNKMSKENTAKNETAPTSISREAMEYQQTIQATAIGCDERKAISGFEYLVIFSRSLVALGLLPKENLPTALEAAKGMKANNSALRQWLYERSEKAAKTTTIAAKYMEM